MWGDFASGGSSNDVIIGGNDRLFGGAENGLLVGDRLDGDEGQDCGILGKDVLISGDGANQLFGDRWEQLEMILGGGTMCFREE